MQGKLDSELIILLWNWLWGDYLLREKDDVSKCWDHGNNDQASLSPKMIGSRLWVYPLDSTTKSKL